MLAEVVDDISSTKKRLKIQIPEEAVSSEINSAFQHLNMNAKVAGFRPGKVPLSILEKRFGKDVKAQVIERLVPDYYMRALKEAELVPVADPEIESQIEINSGQPLDMTFTVEVRPKLENLDYEGIELKELPTEPTDEEIDKAFDSIRKERATLEPAEVAEPGGHVVIDYEAFDGEKLLENVSSKDYQFELESKDLPPEFARETLGKKAGDTYEFSVTYPKEHPGEDLAGKTVNFKVLLKDVKKQVLPDLDDALAKELGIDNLEKMRAKVVENIQNMKKYYTLELQKREASEKLLLRHDFELPESLLKREIEILIEETKSKQQSDKSLNKPLKSDEELRAMVEPDAIRNLKGQTLIELIGEKEKISVEEDDIKKRLLEISRDSGMQAEALVEYYRTNPGALEMIRSNIYETKVLEKVVSKATFVKEKGD